jgi:SAM-dependent methyltransferase
MLGEGQDAYGRAMLDHLDGRGGEEIVERDDGFLYTGAGPEVYLAPYRRWAIHERRCIRWVRGRVLDVGCGAGRVTLHLRDRGHEVRGFDVSPLAIEACRRRGIGDVEVRPITRIGREMGTFDTIVMLGSTLGLFGNAARARRLLLRMHRMTGEGGRIVASTRDPHATDDPLDLEYLRRNELRGRMPGQWRMRIRYRDLRTPWFDHLTVSGAELGRLLDGTGWRIDRLEQGPAGRYSALLLKEDS